MWLYLDGIWGSGTTAAIKWFQGQRGLTQDASVGPNTWEQLYRCVSVSTVWSNSYTYYYGGIGETRLRLYYNTNYNWEAKDKYGSWVRFVVT